MSGWNKLIWLVELCFLIVIAMAYTEMASAHARFIIDGNTPPRSDSDGIKTGPCGNVPRTQNPTTFNAGEQITVEWEETINHPGYYRIAFSPANDQGFDNNVLYQVDDAQDDSNLPHNYSASITLPEVTCEDCTLQLIQYMTERNPPSLYYSCADIRLIANVPPPDVQNVISAGGNNEISLSWQYPNTDNLSVLITQSDTTITGSPVDQQIYNVDDIIGNATVVYNGKGSQFVAENLIAGQSYYFKIYTYSESKLYAAGINIQETVPPAVNDAQAPLAITNLSATPVDGSVQLNWVNPANDFYKVLILWDTNTIQVDPVSNVRYNNDEFVGTARVVFTGLGNAATVTKLLNGQSHYFKVYAHDGNFNYAPGVETDVFLSATGTNQKPVLSLAVSQNNSPVDRVYLDKGPVTVSLMVQDDNDINQAIITWAGTDTRIIDTDISPQTVTFDPSMLSEGTYVVRATVSDNGNPPETATITVGIQVTNADGDDTAGAGGIGHMALLLFLLLLQRYYSTRTRRF